MSGFGKHHTKCIFYTVITYAACFFLCCNLVRINGLLQRDEIYFVSANSVEIKIGLEYDSLSLGKGDIPLITMLSKTVVSLGYKLLKKIELSMRLKPSNSLILEFAFGLLLALLVLAIYSNSLNGPFVFDDLDHITKVSEIRMTTISSASISKAAFQAHDPNRPVANVTFALNYYFGQYRTFGYHLLNVFIHIGTALLLFLLLKAMMDLPGVQLPENIRRWVPFAAALIWAVHPLQTQSVSYIVQRMNSMAAFFYLLAFYCYVKARLSHSNTIRVVLFFVVLLSALLAVGSKQNSAILPLFIALYECFFFQDIQIAWLRKRLPFLVVVCGFFWAAFLVFFRGGNLLLRFINYGGRDFSLWERLLTQFRVIVHYISLLFFPHPSRLNLDYDFAISSSPWQPVATIFSIIAIIILVVLVFRFARTQRVISFAILWFLGNLLIESSIIPLEIIFEHRTYLPSMMVVWMVVLLLARFSNRRIFFIVVGLLTVILSTWTYQRNRVWSDDLLLWEDCVAKSPRKARIHYYLGNIYSERHNKEKAIGYFEEAIRLKPYYAFPYFGLGFILEDQFRLEEAVVTYSKAIAISPEWWEPYYYLSFALAKQRKFAQAIKNCKEALRLNPTSEKIRARLLLLKQMRDR